MDPIIFGDVIDQMSQANIIPTHNENFFEKNNSRERSLLWKIEPRVKPEIIEYTLTLMFFIFLFPVLVKWFWRNYEKLCKITNSPFRKGESIYRNNPMRRQAVCIFIPYTEHLLYYSLSAGFYLKMRAMRNYRYERFYRRLKYYGKIRRITFREDYS